ncbi:hypothetical protein ACS0TY_011004 [Phlomoides rotata]
MIVVQKFENFKMKSRETLESLIQDSLRYSMRWSHWEKNTQREKNLKVLRALPPEWDMKVVAMR